MSKENEYWEQLCETAEALGLLVPETVPFLPTHARKIREELDLAKSILQLLVKLDRAHHSGWQGIAGAQSNAIGAAQCLLEDSDLERADRVYLMASSQYETSNKLRPLSLGEELDRIAQELSETHPEQAHTLAKMAESLER